MQEAGGTLAAPGLATVVARARSDVREVQARATRLGALQAGVDMGQERWSEPSPPAVALSMDSTQLASLAKALQE